MAKRFRFETVTNAQPIGFQIRSADCLIRSVFKSSIFCRLLILKQLLKSHSMTYPCAVKRVPSIGNRAGWYPHNFRTSSGPFRFRCLFFLNLLDRSKMRQVIAYFLVLLGIRERFGVHRGLFNGVNRLAGLLRERPVCADCHQLSRRNTRMSLQRRDF